MSRRRAASELLQKLVMASRYQCGGSLGVATPRTPSTLRAAASNFATRALESPPPPPPPSPSHLPSARRPLLWLNPRATHVSAVSVSSAIPSRSLHWHQRPQSFSAAATSIDGASTDAAAEDDDEPLDSFLAPPSVTFASLGLDSAVCDALIAAGIAHPSAVQASAIPPLLSSSDAVLAAQTGSGKTIAYLAPLISRLRSAQALPRVDDDDDADSDADAELDFDNNNDDEGKAPSTPTLVLPSPGDPPPSCLGLLVLCPNATLCDQVVSVCNEVFKRGGLKLTAARVGGGGGDGGGGASSASSSSQQLPYPPPDVTVATPAGLLGATYSGTSGGGGGGASSRSWSPAAVISRTRAVVLDEADALLGGGYARDSRRVLEGMRAADEGVRLASAKEWLESERRRSEKKGDGNDGGGGGGLSLPAWRDLPQKARRAARDGGARALALELKSSLPSSSPAAAASSSSGLHSDLPRRQYVFAAATMPEDPRMTDAAFGAVGGAGGGGGRARRRDSRRSSNSAPAGAMLRREFPEALWVGGFALHRPTSSVEHVWVDLDDDDGDDGGEAEGEVEGTNRGSKWARALVEAVSSSPSSSSSSSSSSPTSTTLVFARTAGAAAEVSQKLRASGIDALEYSSAVSLADRKRALAALRGAAAATEGGGEEGGQQGTKRVVVVATDAAARGLDLGLSSSGVDHVVQADFAANAVDWLHRVGRTGRGPEARREGEKRRKTRGRVTCLVSRGDAALADAIRGALEAGQPVDGSFSRNRSFRNKLKKYGEFVPRGEVFRGGSGGGR